MKRGLSVYQLDELVELWVECCKEENLWKFKSYETCNDYLLVRQKIYDENSHHREFYGTGLEYIPAVRDADEKLLRWVLKEGVDWSAGRDSSLWWWCLDLITKRLYPANYFYDYPYLREVYLEDLKDRLRTIPEKSDSELIKEWDLYTKEDEFFYIPAYHHRQSFFYLSIRDEIENRGLSREEAVVKSDKRLITVLIITIHNTEEETYKPIFRKSLNFWWWHLDKIKERTYPVELLPEHLQETYVYEDVLSDWERIVYDEEYVYKLCYDDYEAPLFLSRDEIHKRGLDNHPRVVEADKALLRYALENRCIEPYDYDEHDLKEWWWHLDKLSKRIYPAELLPEHLREFYLKSGGRD
ncbi:hypothetical protein F1847_03610 [Thermodesulfobacterium sp. TA1]|uniref:hypothetical protein n=1 Tax=Thermodesulfobacterium sp. TA1 TaxID=2234087 RepID=UPI0012329328|nr:hypothetical protein [Thermodesulfobacterium sp. TA1]QER41877.1 hypothetical protein F1847_03610 [Thermodesulfobacterium sp. TA1]